MAYELLTSRRAFEAETLTAVMLKVLSEPPPPMGTAWTAAFPEIERIVLRAVAKNPEDRYETAKDMRDALEAFLAASEPAMAKVAAAAEANIERAVSTARTLLMSGRVDESHVVLAQTLRENPDAVEVRALLAEATRISSPPPQKPLGGATIPIAQSQAPTVAPPKSPTAPAKSSTPAAPGPATAAKTIVAPPPPAPAPAVVEPAKAASSVAPLPADVAPPPSTKARDLLIFGSFVVLLLAVAVWWALSSRQAPESGSEIAQNPAASTTQEPLAPPAAPAATPSPVTPEPTSTASSPGAPGAPPAPSAGPPGSVTPSAARGLPGVQPPAPASQPPSRPAPTPVGTADPAAPRNAGRSDAGAPRADTPPPVAPSPATGPARAPASAPAAAPSSPPALAANAAGVFIDPTLEPALRTELITALRSRDVPMATSPQNALFRMSGGIDMSVRTQTFGTTTTMTADFVATVNMLDQRTNTPESQRLSGRALGFSDTAARDAGLKAAAEQMADAIRNVLRR
jgi:hypothetical protein